MNWTPAWTLLIAGSVACAGKGEDLPQPLVELTFGRGLANTGSLGGDGRIDEYAAGQGPVLGLSRRGMGFCQLHPSRAGGPGRTPAGGAVVYEHPDLVTLPAVTLSLWFRPEGRNAIARVLYSSNQWDLHVTGGSISYNTRHGGEDQHQGLPSGEHPIREGEWNFIAVTHDRALGTGALYHAGMDAPLRQLVSWTDIPTPDPGPGIMQVGNLEQIRPFRGSIDSVRIFGQILSKDQLDQLLQSEESTAMELDRSVRRDSPLPEVFQHGDVLLSSRSHRKTSIETIAAFKPNRLMWCYTNDASFVQACRDAGTETVQGAINSIAGTAEPDAQALDLDGNPVVAPWMVTFDRKNPWYWGCNNRPRFLAHSLERADKALAAGVDWLQFDDWAMVVSAHSWGGACFCDDCMTAFREYLRANVSPDRRQALGIEPLDDFDYAVHLKQTCGIPDADTYRQKRSALETTPLFEDFQRQSVRRFFTTLRRELDARAGRRVPLSLNATLYRPSQRANYAVDIVDFLQGETWHMELLDLAIPAKVAETVGTWQVFVPKPQDLRTARRGIAASYALGQLMLVPWDMYMGSDATGIRDRYYGTPEQYGDLFDFVRSHRALLDGFETCTWADVVVDLDQVDLDRVRAAAERLFQAQIPFTFALSGSAYYRAALSADRLRGKHVVIAACDEAALPEADRAVLDVVREDVPVVLDRDVTQAQLRSLSPLTVWGPDGVVAIPRAQLQADSRRMVIHVLNRTALEQVSWVSLMVRKGALSSAIVRATWHVPGSPAQDLLLESHGEGMRIIIPSLPIWGIVEVQFD